MSRLRYCQRTTVATHTIWAQISAFLSRTRTAGNLLKRELAFNVKNCGYEPSDRI